MAAFVFIEDELMQEYPPRDWKIFTFKISTETRLGDIIFFIKKETTIARKIG